MKDFLARRGIPVIFIGSILFTKVQVPYTYVPAAHGGGWEKLPMAILEIRHYGDPVLEKVAEPVDKVDDDVRQLLNDMLDTMRDANGIGLAAPQIGISKRIVVVEIEGNVFKMVNPEITFQEGKCRANEGCLSLPEIDGDVTRAERVTIEFLDEYGEPQAVDASGLIARCFQHELDHLEGVLFIKWLGTGARMMLKKRLAAMKKDTKAHLAGK